jgi:prepilin-type N-terminal cleavage/methylation domain-containing protein
MKSYAEKGFTLVEVLVSMTIFSFGILAVINMQLLSASINIKARGMTEGVIAAQNLIEALSLLPYDDALLVDSNDNGLAGFTNQKEAVDVDNADHSDLSDPRYSLFWNVVDDLPFAETKTIRVVVRWDEKGVTSNFEIQMMKTNGA